jgi:hypothetical protein
MVAMARREYFNIAAYSLAKSFNARDYEAVTLETFHLKKL